MLNMSFSKTSLVFSSSFILWSISPAGSQAHFNLMDIISVGMSVCALSVWTPVANMASVSQSNRVTMQEMLIGDVLLTKSHSLNNKMTLACLQFGNAHYENPYQAHSPEKHLHRSSVKVDNDPGPSLHLLLGGHFKLHCISTFPLKYYNNQCDQEYSFCPL